ncbi:MAG: hypothetical protein ACR2PK_14590 [Acidimicrobiales bacterium]
MTSRPFVLVTLIITLSAACSALGQPDLADSSSSFTSSAVDEVAGSLGSPPSDLAFAAEPSAEHDAISETESPADSSTEPGEATVLSSGQSGSDDRSGTQGGPANSSGAADEEGGTAPAAGPVPVTIAPNAALFGVELGTDAVLAVSQLVAQLGVPDVDTGWYVGCPLDGEQLDERLVQWGDLNTYFDRSTGEGAFIAWGYDLRIADGGVPPLGLVDLPGGTHLGDPINEVAAAAGLSVTADESFGVNRVGGSGFEILSDPPLGAPAWGAFVPAIPLCD